MSKYVMDETMLVPWGVQYVLGICTWYVPVHFP